MCMVRMVARKYVAALSKDVLALNYLNRVEIVKPTQS